MKRKDLPGKGRYENPGDFTLLNLPVSTFRALIRHFKNPVLKERLRKLYHSNKSAKK